MPQTYAEVEEPLFLDEPPVLPARKAAETSDIDALFASEDNLSPSAGSRPLAEILFDAPVPKRRLQTAVLTGLILAGAALGFALVLVLLQ